MDVQSLDRHIVVTAGVCGGRPRIAGHRITVETVAVWHVEMGKSVAVICDEYDLDPAEVHAALAYYYDHRPEIDRDRAEGEALVEQLRKSTPSLLAQKLKARRGE